MQRFCVLFREDDDGKEKSTTVVGIFSTSDIAIQMVQDLFSRWCEEFENDPPIPHGDLAPAYPSFFENPNWCIAGFQCSYLNENHGLTVTKFYIRETGVYTDDDTYRI